MTESYRPTLIDIAPNNPGAASDASQIVNGLRAVTEGVHQTGDIGVETLTRLVGLERQRIWMHQRTSGENLSLTDEQLHNQLVQDHNIYLALTALQMAATGSGEAQKQALEHIARDKHTVGDAVHRLVMRGEPLAPEKLALVRKNLVQSLQTIATPKPQPVAMPSDANAALETIAATPKGINVVQLADLTPEEATSVQETGTKNLAHIIAAERDGVNGYITRTGKTEIPDIDRLKEQGIVPFKGGINLSAGNMANDVFEMYQAMGMRFGGDQGFIVGGASLGDDRVPKPEISPSLPTVIIPQGELHTYEKSGINKEKLFMTPVIVLTPMSDGRHIVHFYARDDHNIGRNKEPAARWREVAHPYIVSGLNDINDPTDVILNARVHTSDQGKRFAEVGEPEITFSLKMQKSEDGKLMITEGRDPKFNQVRNITTLNLV